MFKKRKNKNLTKNIGYQQIDIKTKKRRFSKIEVDPYALEQQVDERSVLLKLKEYFFGVWREFFIIKWQKIKDTWKDFRMIISLIFSLILFIIIVDVIFIILRAYKVL